MDNFFQECPPKMNDSRGFTSYVPHTVLEEQIKAINGIVRDDEDRIFLQQNGKNFMDTEWAYMRRNRSCWANECLYKQPTTLAYPPDFTVELRNYNTMMNAPHQPFVCDNLKDYRMTADTGNYAPFK